MDSWSVEYVDNLNTGDYDLIETFVGKVAIENTAKHKYLGFVISNTGDNMVNINSMKNKSIGIIRQIYNRLESLNLRRYYFECAMVFMNIMLRSSILYAAETYHNLKENELREIERIEETFMRKILNTSKGCPIVQLYLTLGQIPARFAIMRMRLSFLQCILKEDEESMISNVLHLQLKNPTRGDWASTCVDNLRQLEITESFQEIKVMKKNTYDKMLKSRIDKIALHYLTSKQGQKGGEMLYTQIEMSAYLLPLTELDITEKRNMFAVKNRMSHICENFPSKQEIEVCFCGERVTMEHIYLCTELNSEKIEVSYKQIFNGYINQQIIVYKRFQKNFNKRENMKNENEKENSSPMRSHKASHSPLA